jgi:hypothetical protein
MRVRRTPGMGLMPKVRSTLTCECPAPTSTMSFRMGVGAACIPFGSPYDSRKLPRPRMPRFALSRTMMIYGTVIYVGDLVYRADFIRLEMNLLD